MQQVTCFIYSLVIVSLVAVLSKGYFFLAKPNRNSQLRFKINTLHAYASEHVGRVRLCRQNQYLESSWHNKTFLVYLCLLKLGLVKISLDATKSLVPVSPACRRTCQHAVRSGTRSTILPGIDDIAYGLGVGTFHQYHPSYYILLLSPVYQRL